MPETSVAFIWLAVSTPSVMTRTARCLFWRSAADLAVAAIASYKDVMAWSSAPRHLGSRDRYIGWSVEARRRNIRFIAYNTRFLILPWVQVPHLASHILGKVARALSDDWNRMYGHPVYFAETFIDPGRFRGTCYRAANWQLLGLTTGRGKDDHTNKPNRPIKQILGLPLTRRFRELLSQ